MDKPACPFSKTILSMAFGCEYASRAQEGERVIVVCDSHLAQINCSTVIGLLRESARFALKLTDTTGHLSFGQEKKIMFGGLLGIQQAVHPHASPNAPVVDIHQLVVDAQQAFGSLQKLPYQEIVKAISAYQSDRRKSKSPGKED